MKRTAFVAIAALAAATLAVSALGAQAAPMPTATPPTPLELRQATTAMLQPGMVPAALGGPGAQQIGFYIPTGGQDPYPVCSPPTRDEVIPSLDMTTGYFSTIGQDSEQILAQQAIVYPSVDGAEASWALLAEDIATKCSFTGKGDDAGVRITNGGAPGANVLWTNYQGGSRVGWSEYTVVGLAGDAIVSLRFTDYEQDDTTAGQRESVDTLWAQLADAFAGRTVPSGVQSTTLSIAEAAMVTPSDLGADIPIGTPDQGAWSSFTASLPGQAPLDPCKARLDFFPGGNGSFSASFGDDGGPIISNGFIWQRVFTYDDAAGADAAWAQIARKLPKCNQTTGNLYSKTKPGSRGVARRTPVAVDGTQGWIYREIDTFGAKDKDSRFTTRTYQVWLKSGNVISWLTYGISAEGIKRVNIDEGPINELALELIDRFTDTVVTAV